MYGNIRHRHDDLCYDQNDSSTSDSRIEDHA